jgi:hypothetical protein
MSGEIGRKGVLQNFFGTLPSRVSRPLIAPSLGLLLPATSPECSPLRLLRMEEMIKCSFADTSLPPTSYHTFPTVPVLRETRPSISLFSPEMGTHHHECDTARDWAG